MQQAGLNGTLIATEYVTVFLRSSVIATAKLSCTWASVKTEVLCYENSVFNTEIIAQPFR